MRDALPLLLQLQKMDVEIKDLENQRTALPKSLADTKAALEARRSAHAVKHEELKKAKVAADMREGDLKDQEVKIQKLDGQLNQAKTNKEYSVLKSEISAVKSDCGLIEDDILQLMTKVEVLTGELKAADAEVKTVEAILAPLQKQVEITLADLDGKLAKRRLARDGTTQGIDPEVITLYNRVQGHKTDGRALAKIAEGTCTGCNMELNTQDVNLVMGRRLLVTCKTCGRILYAD